MYYGFIIIRIGYYVTSFPTPSSYLTQCHSVETDSYKSKMLPYRVVRFDLRRE